MDLQLDTEQVILRDTAERFLAERYGYATHCKIADSAAGWSRDIWRDFAAMGWLGLPFALEDGGSGGGPVETAILMEAFGKHLVIEPYLSSVILSGGLIAALTTGSERQGLLAPIIAGESAIAFAHEDRTAPARAEPVSGGYILTADKKLVLGAPLADALLVSAQLSGGGQGVFWVPSKTEGVTLRPYKSIDGQRVADVALHGVVLPANALLGGRKDAGPGIEAALAVTLGALCADAVGAIAALVSATLDYAKTRVQFGQPIGKFQALQHRLVAMKVKEEEARAACLFATLSLAQGTETAGRALSGAKAKIGRCARSVHQEAIQLHGAIGTTAELSVGAYAKRLIAFETLFGTTRDHLRRYAGLIAEPRVAASGLLGESAAR